jgi:hypothetical protein
MFVPYPCLRLIHGFVFVKNIQNRSMSNFGKVCQRAPDLATCLALLTHSWPVARVFVAGWLKIIGLELFESLML